jgi:hypothetical protein
MSPLMASLGPNGVMQRPLRVKSRLGPYVRFWRKADIRRWLRLLPHNPGMRSFPYDRVFDQHRTNSSKRARRAVNSS